MSAARTTSAKPAATHSARSLLPLTRRVRLVGRERAAARAARIVVVAAGSTGGQRAGGGQHLGRHDSEGSACQQLGQSEQETIERRDTNVLRAASPASLSIWGCRSVSENERGAKRSDNSARQRRPPGVNALENEGRIRGNGRCYEQVARTQEMALTRRKPTTREDQESATRPGQRSLGKRPSAASLRRKGAVNAMDWALTKVVAIAGLGRTHGCGLLGGRRRGGMEVGPRGEVEGCQATAHRVRRTQAGNS